MAPAAPVDVLPPPAAGMLLPGDVVTVAGPGGVPVEARVVPRPPDRVARLSWPRRFGLLLLPLAVVGVLWGGPAGFFGDIKQALAPEGSAAPRPPADGAALFAQNCASCHGARGDGKGTASLTTPARYFGAEPFKFAASLNAKKRTVPTDGELVALLKRGIPGSSMPSFANLADGELRALVGHVRTLTRWGRYEWLLADAIKKLDDGGDEPDPAALSLQADAECAVGTPIPVPASFAPASEPSTAAGRAVFLKNCASCHGSDGLGDGPQVAQLRNANNTPAFPRNLKVGVFKGGESKVHLYARLRLGIPGTPMPAFDTLTPDETADLINFVLGLSDVARQQRAEEARQAAEQAAE